MRTQSVSLLIAASCITTNQNRNTAFYPVSRFRTVARLLCIFLFFPTILLAQYQPEKSFSETYSYGCNPKDTSIKNCRVITALSGLKLRASASPTGKVLDLMPFGDMVECTDN